MNVSAPKLHHIALTVSDLDASVAWYERVFGISFRFDVPHEGGVGRVLADDAGTLGIVLHMHDSNDQAPFAESRTGLDHVGFVVSSRSELEAWQVHLENNGVAQASPADRPLTQSAIVDEPYGSVLVFRDPDNIQLELVTPPAMPAEPEHRERSS